MILYISFVVVGGRRTAHGHGAAAHVALPRAVGHAVGPAAARAAPAAADQDR